MSGFDFVDDLPEAGKPGRKADPLVEDFAAALMANANRWAKYPKKHASAGGRNTIASRIRTGHALAPHPFRQGGFEAACRDGELYVRYVGGGQ